LNKLFGPLFTGFGSPGAQGLVDSSKTNKYPELLGGRGKKWGSAAAAGGGGILGGVLGGLGDLFGFASGGEVPGSSIAGDKVVLVRAHDDRGRFTDKYGVS
jgi:hypothetical protein